MNEKMLAVISGLATTLVWGYILFYMMGFGNILYLAIQRTGPMGSFFLILIGIIVFFLPYMIISKVVDGSKYQDEKKYKHQKENKG